MDGLKTPILSKRIPSWAQILPVYGVVILLVYSWTILWFFWKLRSWLFFLSAPEILTIGAYSLATNLLECLAVLGALVAASMLLPRAWLYKNFVARGTAAAISGLGYMMYVAFQFRTKDDYPTLLLKPWSVGAAAVIGLLLVLFAPRITIVRRVLEGLAERATILVYLLTPLSLVALVTVLIRWII